MGAEGRVFRGHPALHFSREGGKREEDVDLLALPKEGV